MKKLTEEAVVRDILKTHYGQEATEISGILAGVRNESFIVVTPSKKYVLRIYAPNRTRDYINFELDAMRIFKEHDVPVPFIFANVHGDKLSFARINEKDRGVILMDFMPGKTLSSKDSEILEPLAILQARMHKIALENIEPRKSAGEILSDWSRWSKEEREKMKPILDEHNIGEVYLDAFDKVRGSVEAMHELLAKVPYAECHNDLFGGNVLIENNRIAAVLDFDNLTNSPLIFDVVNTIFSWLFDSHPDIDPAVIKKYIDAYQSERRLSDEELQLLIPLINIRNFAITNSLYTHGFIEGPDRLKKTMQFYKNFVYVGYSDV